MKENIFNKSEAEQPKSANLGVEFSTFIKK